MLTLPYRLRYRLAWDHALCRAVLGVYARTLLAFYARTARAHGIPALSVPRGLGGGPPRATHGLPPAPGG